MTNETFLAPLLSVLRDLITWFEAEEIALPRPEDLIIMKAVAGRPRDIVDIESLLDAYPTLDRRRIRRWVKEFATVLERPEIFDNLQSLFAKQRKRK